MSEKIEIIREKMWEDVSQRGRGTGKGEGEIERQREREKERGRESGEI